MLDAGVIWGGAITLYVLSGVLILSDLDTGQRPDGVLPGSVTKQQWEQCDKRATRRAVIWSVGLALLLGAWSLFA